MKVKAWFDSILGMNAELRALIDTSRWCRKNVEAVAALLPVDDGELDRLVEEVTTRGELMAFHFVVIGALATGRPVHARHLEGGLMMLNSEFFMGNCALRMEGEVAEHLVQAVKASAIGLEMRAAALMVAAAWAQKHREGRLPADLIPQARLLARAKGLNGESWPRVMALVGLVKDESLTQLVMELARVNAAKEELLERGAGLAQSMVKTMEGSLLELVPVEPPRTLSALGPVRRAVARVGRNDPCPCGSGQKYKRCCQDKDHERLHFSSFVEGKTHAELREDRESYLTAELLAKLKAHDMRGIDARKVKRELLPELLMRLAGALLFDELATAFEQLELNDDLTEAWDMGTRFAAMKGRADVVQRLVRARYGEVEPEPEELGLHVQLLRAQGDSARFLAALEAVSLRAVTSTDHSLLEDMALAALYTPYKALGILVARGLLPLVRKRQVVCVYDEILRAHDELNISADDPYGDIVEKRFTEEVVDTGKDAEALRLARDALEQKAAETRRLKEENEAANRRLRLLEKEQVRLEKEAQARHTTAPESEELVALRRKIKGMEVDMRENNAERADQRRKLAAAYTELQTLRKKEQEPSAQGAAENDAEDMHLGDVVSSNQPVRLIEFPRKFQETLAKLPRQVVRGALALLGRMAGGEPAAFAGVRCVYAVPGMVRARIGIDHRLLLRLRPECVEVVDLISRQDLERRLKTLA